MDDRYDSSTGSSGAAKQRVKAEAEARKDGAANTVDDVASAMDRAADELRDNPTLSRYAEDLAGSMHGIAGRLRGRSVDELAEELRQLARSNPTLLVLGSIGAGLALARFMKASPRREHGSRGQDPNRDEVLGAGMSAPAVEPYTADFGSSGGAFASSGAQAPGGPDFAAPNTDTRRA